MLEMVSVIAPRWWKLFNQHIGLKNLAHLHAFCENLSTQILVGMNLSHDRFVIHNLELQPLADDILFLSGAV